VREAYAASITREPMLFLVASEPRAGAARRRAKARRGRRLEEAPAPHPREVEAATGTVGAADGERAAEEGPHGQLTLDHGIADIRSIGSRMAKRFERHGIATVRDLVKADPAALAVRLDAGNLSAQAICDWQDGALLACAVPGLSATHAELLVGAGYRSTHAIAAAEPDQLCADLLGLALTPAGRHVLRKGGAPDIERIKAWIALARDVQAA
jgi:hypothetical protein